MLEPIYYSSSSTATGSLELLPLLACVVAALALGLALAPSIRCATARPEASRAPSPFCPQSCAW